MTLAQPGILAPVPPHAKYLTFTLTPGAAPGAPLRALCERIDGEQTVVGLGLSLVRTLGHEIAGLVTAPRHVGPGIDVPSTPAALWCWLRGEDRGELLHRARAIEHTLAPAFRLEQTLDAFMHDTGRDLSGYEDGTENPEGDDALAAALVSGQGGGLDGASFVAVQQWLHDFSALEAMSTTERDNAVGRRQSDNEELADAPPSAHVKRTAQESFDPEAFVLRRSMPWTDAHGAGLVFVAFGQSFGAFAAQLRRMVGAEDGISDAIFKFTRPVTGAYYWCPPIKDGRIDLSAVGL